MQRNKGDNTYIVDNESGAEMARLLEQDKITTEAMGGLLAELSEAALEQIVDVLDIGCGPGGWALELAQAYPTMDVTGIDLSHNMLDYARAHAEVRRLPNVEFRFMNVLNPLEFPVASFDLVNLRYGVAYIPPQQWPSLLAECTRILRPGGIMRITDGETGSTTSAAVETYIHYINQALWKSGRSFSPTGRYLGLLPVLPRLLRQAGFTQIENKANLLDGSFGTNAYTSSYQDAKLLFKLTQPFLINTLVATQEELDTLYEQVIHEMSSEDYCGIVHLLTVWGKKSSH